MELFAEFQTWQLGGSAAQIGFNHLANAEYQFTGMVLWVYQDGDPSDPIVVVGADQFRFYINSRVIPALRRGDVVSGRGTLVLDHYIWVEFLPRYVDPPDLFIHCR